ncbi:MAG: phosphodiester glycosidase family protein [Chthoniobacterales bacterium]|nr:phosphodiester glycosidase family protein [Chthoniobacterales bacterium]
MRASKPAILQLLLLVFVAIAPARAEWTVVAAEPQNTGRAGVVHLKTTVEDENGTRATLQLAVFSTKSATLRVIDDPEEQRADLATTMRREKAIAGVNGGYFSPEHAAVGLLISDGRRIAPQSKARLLSGVVSVANGKVQVQRAADFSAKAKVTAARQCGPFLVERSKAVAGLNNTRAARRSFVAVGAGERALLGFSSHVTLAQVARILATPGVAGDFKIERALNLDGGSSSGFWFEQGPFSISEQKPVRDHIAVVPK